MTDIQILLLGFLLIAIAHAWLSIKVSLAWKEVMLNKHKRMVDDFKAIHKTYLKSFEGSVQKPIENPTLNQMSERIHEMKVINKYGCIDLKRLLYTSEEDIRTFHRIMNEIDSNTLYK